MLPRDFSFLQISTTAGGNDPGGGSIPSSLGLVGLRPGRAPLFTEPRFIRSFEKHGCFRGSPPASVAATCTTSRRQMTRAREWLTRWRRSRSNHEHRHGLGLFVSLFICVKIFLCVLSSFILISFAFCSFFISFTCYALFDRLSPSDEIMFRWFIPSGCIRPRASSSNSNLHAAQRE